MKIHPALLFTAALFLNGCCRTCAPAPDQPATALPLKPSLILDGVPTPECAVVDPATGFIYVSNMEATPELYWADDGTGSISRLKPDGTMDQPRWVASTPEFVLNSPKGMCILGGKLYVTDNTRALTISLADAKPAGVIAVADAKKLNDMATDGREVYVTDTVRGLVQRLDLSGAGKHATVAEIEGVNGITFARDKMFAVSWDLHEIYEVDLIRGSAPQAFGLAHLFTNLDGIEVLDDGSILVSDFMGNKVSRISSDRANVTQIAQLTTPADIGWDRKTRRLFVPQLTENKLAIFTLP